MKFHIVDLLDQILWVFPSINLLDNFHNLGIYNYGKSARKSPMKFQSYGFLFFSSVNDLIASHDFY